MKKVFISSPYTIGDVGENVSNAMQAANDLIDVGFAPYCPLLSHFLHIMHPRPWKDWMNIDIVFMLECDCVLRLPGKSVGADIEVNGALEFGLPVYYTINDIPC